MTDLSPEQIKKLFPFASKGLLEANCGTLPLPAKKKVTETVVESKKGEAWDWTSSNGDKATSVRFVILGVPMGKPRMTQRDKWYRDPNHVDPKKRKRKAIVKYDAWKETVLSQVPTLPDNPITLNWTAYLPIPKSHSKKKAEALKGQLHTEKPDRDNLDKALLDILFTQDKSIAKGTICKRWDDGNGPRVEIEVFGKE